jgi:uncharacterized protein
VSGAKYYRAEEEGRSRRRAATAEASAVRAYNKRLVSLSRLAIRIERERARLDRNL